MGKKKYSNPTPKPVPVNVVCDLCGLAWHQHQADENGDITTLECIRLLKAQPRIPLIIDRPYPVPLRPWSPPHYPYSPYYGTVCVSQSSSTSTSPQIDTTKAYNTSPKVLMASSAGV